MTTLHTDGQHPGDLVVFVKGAPDVLLERCTFEGVNEGTVLLTNERRATLRAENEQLAVRALRTLGVATRTFSADVFTGEPSDDVERDLVFLGLIGMIDPPREEARAAVAQCRKAGIRPIMMTGDHPLTAAAIASELGITTPGVRAVTGTELSRLSDSELEPIVREVGVYARVDPEHKLRIVQALQRGGAVVAMTGDGVNDAPALKAADIGVAMGITGTDVSREAADMVLADDNFATIVAAVEEGRTIYDNIQKFLRYLLSSNLGEVLTVFLGVVLAGPIGLRGEPGEVVLPLIATQVLWINLVTDSAPALALGLDPSPPGVMRRPPRRAGAGVISGEMGRGILLTGLLVAVGTLGMLDASLPGGLLPGTGSLAYARTMAFTTLVFCQLINVWCARSDTRSAFEGLFRNRWVWAAAALSLALQVLVLELPILQQAFGTVSLSPAEWLRCFVVAFSVLWVRELVKWPVRVRARRAGPAAESRAP